MTTDDAHALSSMGAGAAAESTGLTEEPTAERDAALEDGTEEEGPAPVDTPPMAPVETAPASGSRRATSAEVEYRRPTPSPPAGMPKPGPKEHRGVKELRWIQLRGPRACGAGSFRFEIEVHEA